MCRLPNGWSRVRSDLWFQMTLRDLERSRSRPQTCDLISRQYYKLQQIGTMGQIPRSTERIFVLYGIVDFVFHFWQSTIIGLHQFVNWCQNGGRCAIWLTLWTLITGFSEIHINPNSNWQRRDLCTPPNTPPHYFDRFIRDNNHIWRWLAKLPVTGSVPIQAGICMDLLVAGAWKADCAIAVLQPAYGGLRHRTVDLGTGI